jgi:hypothetical protein
VIARGPEGVAALPPDRGRWNDFRTGDFLDFHHGGTVLRCRVVSPPWSDNTGVVVEVESPDGRVIRCHDTDLRFPPSGCQAGPAAGEA